MPSRLGRVIGEEEEEENHPSGWGDEHPILPPDPSPPDLNPEGGGYALATRALWRGGWGLIGRRETDGKTLSQNRKRKALLDFSTEPRYNGGEN